MRQEKSRANFDRTFGSSPCCPALRPKMVCERADSMIGSPGPTADPCAGQAVGPST